ncbi:ubiquitin family protein, partial [Toxoplasma gondii TgCatPRC2]
MQISIADD